MFSKDTIYVHSGDAAFDIDKFEYVQNCTRLSRPLTGGLWASPEGSKEGWQEISIRPQDVRYFKFKLADTSKVLVLDNQDALEGVPKLTSETEWFPVILDFEKLSKEYDVIYYKYNDEMDALLPRWDCDCILVMNPNVINVIE